MTVNSNPEFRSEQGQDHDWMEDPGKLLEELVTISRHLSILCTILDTTPLVPGGPVNDRFASQLLETLPNQLTHVAAIAEAVGRCVWCPPSMRAQAVQLAESLQDLAKPSSP